MHLKQLKLTGFKSFVDSTAISFPSQLVAVVGPNGCGKSNIIDAVKWVLGESSAKNLRGESLTDVIFNGSTSRKAVGQASVELMFDNSMGRLGGQYSHYQEIAIKRLVTRDGDSFYFLNGTRCRRRDITDLFLGTGAGARGYAIIGQGTVSKLVEAQPEELRAYLEEAAGISKYKERRRETVVRINHARDNLVRVTDIREELSKQLQRLEKQAKAAIHYQELKSLEHSYKAEILALRWQHLNQEQLQLEQHLNHLLLEYEQHQASLAEASSQNTSTRIHMEQAQDTLQVLQEQFYQLTAEIARLEEQIQRQHQEKQRLLDEKQQIQIQQWELENQLKQDNELLRDYESTVSKIQADLAKSQNQALLKQQAYQTVQQEKSLWQTKFAQIQQKLAQAEQEVQVQLVHKQHINRQQQDLQLRLEKARGLLIALDEDMAVIDLSQQVANLTALESKKEQQENEYQALFLNLNEARQLLTQTETNLHKAQDEVQQLTTAHAALIAMLTAALEVHYPASTTMQPRLLEVLVVDKEWQYACEMVLKDYLHATVIESVDSVLSASLQSFDMPQCFAVSDISSSKKKSYPCLAEKMTGKIPYFLPNLYHIFTAATLAEACMWLPYINDDESIITPDGCWIAKGWVRIAGKAREDSFSLISKHEELSQLEKALKQAQEALIMLQQKRDELYVNLKEYEDKAIRSRDVLTSIQEEERAAKAQEEAMLVSLSQLSLKKEDVFAECEQLESDLINLAEQHFIMEQALAAALSLKQQFKQEQEQSSSDKHHFDTAFYAAQIELDEARSLVHQLELEKERKQLIQKQTAATILSDELKLRTLDKRLKEIDEQLVVITVPNAALEENLIKKLTNQKELEQHLIMMRENLSVLKKECDVQEAKIKAEDKQIKILQEKIQQLQLQLQTFRVQIGNLLEILNEQGFQAQTLLSKIAPGITILEREQRIEEIVEKINTLGAINLAAIEEYENESQRKSYLDGQYEDLTNALAMLEAAIEKLDKETRARFKQTFDEINATFQSLFPRLFGGGRANLELTGDNLLDAGVLVMAQPPGKRNNTIHLLSGGEKAMTAVALIFAIFQLNPSPFCMLDEVDAPLDDVNVSRFCDLVKEMSQVVQFLFITHNKVTMELANHLIGVTMREPGVSRIVTVDVEDALAITEA
ncbi:chromosome partition protein smc [Legionella beliardensis]|uniref:Chromosome partition protein Smc n=1 Tax=Legionella beliardensis TaxID=91822 RepID=A0A378I472_9GAMM|nr:chromosome segregation protein SMC [Legionella beliardensis]STX30007.1 chromosome partition protein smc [Legionella beliardensis]